MAEIKIEKKKPIWPWILVGIIIIGLAIYFLADKGSGDREQQSAYGTEHNERSASDKNNASGSALSEERDNTRVNKNGRTQTATAVGDPAVDAYVTFVREDIKGEDLKNNQEKVRQAFMHLTEACEAKAQQVGYKSNNMNIVREHTEQLSSGSDASNAQNIRATADILSDELANIQKTNFPKLDKKASKLKEASADISPDQPIADQSREVKSFLTEAADLLEDMEETDNR